MGALNEWVELEELGRGGQGVALKVVQRPSELNALVASLRDAINDARERTSDGQKETVGAANLIQLLREELARPTCVLKKLHQPSDARNPDDAKARMSREIGMMRSVSHPALLKIVDSSDQGDLWYVSEFHAGGTLDETRELFAGDLLECLRALRPVIDGVAQLHNKGVVHRDIKPENIFVSASGNLVLGDFGLAIPIEIAEETRLTDTYENAGTWDWMPIWAQGKRLENVAPTFDVYALGKVLWWMLSGKHIFQLWYFDKPENNLECIFNDMPEMKLVNELLAGCIVEDESACQIHNATELGNAIDELVSKIWRTRLLNSLKIGDLWAACPRCSGSGFEPGSQPGNWHRCNDCEGKRGGATVAGMAIAELMRNLDLMKVPPSM